MLIALSGISEANATCYLNKYQRIEAIEQIVSADINKEYYAPSVYLLKEV